MVNVVEWLGGWAFKNVQVRGARSIVTRRVPEGTQASKRTSNEVDARFSTHLFGFFDVVFGNLLILNPNVLTISNRITGVFFGRCLSLRQNVG